MDIGGPALSKLLADISCVPHSTHTYYLQSMLAEHNIDRTVPVAAHPDRPSTIIHIEPLCSSRHDMITYISTIATTPRSRLGTTLAPNAKNRLQCACCRSAMH
jgi:hypothetical protein